MREFTIHRSSDMPLIFKGEVLASASTFAPAKKRWTECMLYLSDSGRFVSHSTGKSKMPNEIDIVNAQAFTNVVDAVNFFRDRNGRLSWLTSQIVRGASASFPDLQDQVSERV